MIQVLNLCYFVTPYTQHCWFNPNNLTKIFCHVCFLTPLCHAQNISLLHFLLYLKRRKKCFKLVFLKMPKKKWIYLILLWNCSYIFAVLINVVVHVKKRERMIWNNVNKPKGWAPWANRGLWLVVWNVGGCAAHACLLNWTHCSFLTHGDRGRTLKGRSYLRE